MIEHGEAINLITLCLKHKDLRTKLYVLELLSAVSLLDNGVVLSAFDNFKLYYKETYHFETLMKYFLKDPSDYDFNVEFAITCMKFFNAIVNSAENKNFRVYLQYKFFLLGVDDYLENKLCLVEWDNLKKHIDIYKMNCLDVQQLVEDSNSKNEAISKLENATNNFNKTQDDVLNKISELQNELCQMRKKLDSLEKEKYDLDTQVFTLKENNQTMLKQLQRESANNLTNPKCELDVQPPPGPPIDVPPPPGPPIDVPPPPGPPIGFPPPPGLPCDILSSNQRLPVPPLLSGKTTGSNLKAPIPSN